MNKKKKNPIFKIIFGSSVLTTIFLMSIIIPCLIIFSFFGGNLNTGTVDENIEYAERYKEVLNKYMKDGYVPLNRIIYFYRENEDLTFEQLYLLNQDSSVKNLKDIEQVCLDPTVRNLVACSMASINEHESVLVINQSHFNFPLNDNYTITSFQNEERIVFGEKNQHGGWDFAAPPQTPVYSVCKGTVDSVNYTQQDNVPYEDRGNKVGNNIGIKCIVDGTTYTIYYRHLYPNSAKVKVGDQVEHWTELASVGTTGWSTGNHLHWEVQDINGKTIDGMLLVDLNMKKE